MNAGHEEELGWNDEILEKLRAHSEGSPPQQHIARQTGAAALRERGLQCRGE
jgi:hypothetical protein